MVEIIRFYWLLGKLDGKQQDWTIVVNFFHQNIILSLEEENISWVKYMEKYQMGQ